MKLDPKLLSDFARHIAMENGNAIAYQTASSWFAANAWCGFSKEFDEDSKSELSHAQAFSDYCALSGEAVNSEVDIPTMPTEPTVATLAAFAAKLEADTEQSMRDLLAIAEEVKDGAAVEFISGRLIGQVVESKNAADFSLQVSRCDDSALVILNAKI
jgi:ferritin